MNEPRLEELACGVVIYGGGLKRCPDRLAGEADQLLEGFALDAGGWSDLPLPANCASRRVARRRDKGFDLLAVPPNEPVHRRGSRSTPAAPMEASVAPVRSSS